jgi:N-formylglutamate deformylase
LTTLPILISIPHGGTEIPEEIRGMTLLTRKEILEDVDAFTQEIYHVENVLASVTTPIARTFIDLNRAPDDLPPRSPDGAVKTRTANLEPIYRDANLADELVYRLIERYHEPYHKRIEGILKTDRIKLALDCHSMSSISPPISRYHGRVRPTVCLGNASGRAASPDLVSMLANCFREVFELPHDEVAINKPFSGGYITQRYGNNPVPWIQIEMNRRLYFTMPWLNPETLTVERTRLELLNRLFRETLSLFMDCVFS